MQRSLIAATLALSVVACGSAPVAPTTPAPPPAAVLNATGALTFVQCAAAGSDTVSCQFQGNATNIGAGCASSVTGQTFSYRANSNTALDSKSWSLTGVIRPGATFTYSGAGLVVPTDAGGTYATTFAFTSVSCS